MRHPLTLRLRAALGAALCAAALCAAACEDEPAATPPDQGAPLDAGPDLSRVDMADRADMAAVTGLENLPGGNPLVPEVALYPFPSNLYLSPDAQTATGWRLDLPAQALPPRLTTQMFDGIDGFSRVPLILTHLPGGVAPQSLPSAQDAAATLSQDSSVFLLEEGTWQRVPALVELDMNAASAQDQALIIRPLRALKAATNHVVLITTRVTKPDGSPHQPNAAFAALRDGLRSDEPALERQRAEFEQVRAAWRAQGLGDDQLVQAWAFRTRSAQAVVGPALHMQAVAAAAAVEPPTIVSDSLDARNRQIVGTFKAPNFVNAQGLLEPDAQGLPRQLGTRDVDFVLTIPLNIQEPRPLILFGHGFFYQRVEATRSSFNDLCVQGRFSAAAVDFEGFNEASIAESITLLTERIPEVDKLIAKQLQAYTHFTVLSRVIKTTLAPTLERELADGQRVKVIDPTQVHYMGISNGATFGAVIAATSPELERAALVVGGGGLVHFLERAESWNSMGAFFKRRWRSPMQLQLVMSLLQHKFDPIDSLNFVERLVHDRHEGLRPMKVALHMAVHDSLVHNMLTDMVARTAGVPMVVPSPRQTWGVEPLAAPWPQGADPQVKGALFVYDEGLEPSSLTNVAPKKDNGAHESVRRLDVYRRQIIEFIEHGKLVQVCDGACDPD